MKKIFTVIFLLLIVAGCKPKGSMYVYKDSGTKGADSDTIFLESDSIAYIKAYEHFIGKKKVFNDMIKMFGERCRGEINEPLSFSVFREDGTEIFPEQFNLSDTLDKIKKRILESKSILQQDIKYDSSKVNELLKFFDVEKDKFSPEGLTWYVPKDKPSIPKSGVYCYISKKNDLKPTLRFVAKYTSERMLFVERIYFAIGDNAYAYEPYKVRREYVAGTDIEWADDALNEQSKEIILALIKQDKAEVKFSGTNYYDVRTISKKQIESINRTIELYQAMGGEM